MLGLVAAKERRGVDLELLVLNRVLITDNNATESNYLNHFHKFFYCISRYPSTALDRASKYISIRVRVFQVVMLF